MQAVICNNALPVSKRSVACGTEEKVVNKLGKALSDEELAVNHDKK